MSLMFLFTYYGKINESGLCYDSSRLKFGIKFIYSESEYTPRFNVDIIFCLKKRLHFLSSCATECLFFRTLSNVTNSIVNVDDFKVHENKDGSVDKTKTDLYMHLVDRKDNSILEVDEVLRVIDQNIEKLDYLFKVMLFKQHNIDSCN